MVIGDGVREGEGLPARPLPTVSVLGSGQLLGQDDRKAAAPSLAAFDLQAAAVAIDDMLDDRQPKTGSAIAAGNGRVNLTEIIEKAGQFVLRNTDACIGYRETNWDNIGACGIDTGRFRFLSLYFYGNFSLFSKLDGIGKKVQ